MISNPGIRKATFVLAITVTSFLSVQSLLRGYRETCGTHLHARSRDTVAEGRQCDKFKGLTCTRGMCDCSSSNLKGETGQVIWNRTHCVTKLNSTCRIIQSHVPELPFLPNTTRTEELLCGRGAFCSTEDGCLCEPGFHADINHYNCISDSGQSTLWANSFLRGTGLVSWASLCVAVTLQNHLHS